MKKYFLLLVLPFLLACSPAGQMKEEDLQGKRLKENPRLPTPQLRADVIPEGATEEELRLMLQEINKELTRPNISKQDMEQGWYFSLPGEKKYGTPESWVWVDGRWMSPDRLEVQNVSGDRTLCRQTAGTYRLSCIESDSPYCEHVPETKCECIEGSKWKGGQGCILTGDNGEYIAITPEELRKGGYLGLPNEKKLNTPSNWVWKEVGRSSRWQDPRFK